MVFDDDFFDILAAVSGGDGGAGGGLDDIATCVQLGIMVDDGVFVGYVAVGLDVGEHECVGMDVSGDDVGAILGVEYTQFVHGYAHDVRNLLEVNALIDVYGVGDYGARCQCRRDVVVVVIGHRVIGGYECRDVVACFARQEGVYFPEVFFASAGASQCLIDVAGAAVVGGYGQ